MIDPCDIAGLQTSALFRDVPPSKLRLVSMASRRETHPSGDAIVSQGEPSDAVYVVVEGKVEVRRKSNGEDVTVASLDKGYVIGDVAVLLGEPYVATIVAVSPVTVLRIDGDVFLQIVRDVPQISMALIRDLSRRVVSLAQKFADAQHH